MMNINTRIYREALQKIVNFPASKNIHGISFEFLSFRTEFSPEGHIAGSSEKYIKNELDWYLSQDRNIKGHPGIENNKVWQSCAAEDGSVNSNYGWCVFSKENYEQFEMACRSIEKDPSTKQAVMIYTRPSINIDWNDGEHAEHDMICTIYVNLLLRDGKLIYIVHMRSNDIWYGLRNDLAWHQFVFKMAVEWLNGHGIKCEPTKIIWNADSMHLYERNILDVKKWLEENDGFDPVDTEIISEKV